MGSGLGLVVEFGFGFEFGLGFDSREVFSAFTVNVISTYVTFAIYENLLADLLRYG